MTLRRAFHSLPPNHTRRSPRGPARLARESAGDIAKNAKNLVVLNDNSSPPGFKRDSAFFGYPANLAMVRDSTTQTIDSPATTGSIQPGATQQQSFAWQTYSTQDATVSAPDGSIVLPAYSVSSIGDVSTPSTRHQPPTMTTWTPETAWSPSTSSVAPAFVDTQPPTVEQVFTHPSMTSQSVTAGDKPTTMSVASSSLPIPQSSSTSHSTPLTFTRTFASASRFTPTPTETVANGESNASSQTTGLSGTAIAILSLLLSIGFVILFVVLRMRFIKAKEKRDRRRRAALVVSVASKESSIWGGRDRGDEKDDYDSLESPPGVESNWTNGFAVQAQLHPPAPPRTYDGRFSRRGSGWVVASEFASPVVRQEVAVLPPPNVHVPDSPRSNARTDSLASSSSGEDKLAVVTSATRVSLSSVYTLPTQHTAATYNSINPYGAGRERLLAAVTEESEEDSKPWSAPPGTDRSRAGPNSLAPPLPAPPSNTAIGVAARPGGGGSLRPRIEREILHKSFSAALGRAQEPLRINKKVQISIPKSPTRAYHTSSTTFDDEDPAVGVRDSVNDAHSFGNVMLTAYGEKGSIVPAFMESPSIGSSEKFGDGNRKSMEAHRRKSAKMPLLPPHDQLLEPDGTIGYGRSLTAGYSSVSSTMASDSEGSTKGFTSTKGTMLTVTSPSGCDVSFSTAAQGMFSPLLANAQQEYRSPTYSIYNMYDGDDERPAMPRRSLIAGRPK
ncbi:hypothetical protein FRB99_001637 [Tulasnella sp. 403]|nr:hypothetical protein FRB99_001637 [Tulasnella sp. 403]